MNTCHQISFYPVGNGDSCQIVLHNGRRILFDFRHHSNGENEAAPEIDLKSHLRAELRAAARDYVDIVAFTHADNDHIQGSTEFFELEHAKCYHGDGRIKIRELWVPAALVIEEATKEQRGEEFVTLRQEARHRLIEGRGIRVFSRPDKVLDWLGPILESRGEPRTARDHLFVDAGKLVPGFTLANDGVEFFCHSPFIEHCEGEEILRNSASLIFNVRFHVDGERYDFLQIGDADHGDLQAIVSITNFHGNDDRLAWDLFNIPHHCSYLALSDEKGDRETVPTEPLKKLLSMGKPGAYIVSSSRPMPDTKESYERIQPPHIQARRAYERYLAEINGRKFLVTMEQPNEVHPRPLVFEIERRGISWKQVMVGATSMTTLRPPRAGK